MSAFPVEMEAPDRFAFAITLARFAALVCSTVVVFRYLANGDGITPTEKRAFITMAAWAPIAAIRNALLLALSSSLACRLAAGLERAVISLLICYVGAIACSWRPGSMFDRYWQSPVNVFSVYAVVEFIAIFCMFSGQPDVSFLAKATTLLVIHFPAMAPIVYHGMATLSETFSDLEDNLQQQSHAPKPRKMMVVTSVLTCLFIPLIVALIYDYGILSSKEFIEVRCAWRVIHSDDEDGVHNNPNSNDNSANDGDDSSYDSNQYDSKNEYPKPKTYQNPMHATGNRSFFVFSRRHSVRVCKKRK